MPDIVAELEALFNPEEEDRSVYVQCRKCLDWTLVEVPEDSDFAVFGRPEIVCEYCGERDFDYHSITSKNTFNPETAKKRRPKGYKKH